ncbi:hypothetical protein BD410DRAFT_838048 [Rickenella mellea]|uniref:G domain-containing protein n=1 Tax=Rickenella mellea TaxID=50990 RepID=A0A4Y7QAA7_9AGAM|nr:hypothetical protein BD410DRAFT_838048 [Rickenella mellea]
MTSNRRNVIIFGETGAGKSSLINLLSGQDLAKVSSAAAGCTFATDAYDFELGGEPFRLFDTVGLNEGDNGTVSAKDAIVNLYKLICSLDDGVALLIFCFRAPRIKDATVNNYQMFYSEFCQKQVPIIIAVMGLEDEENMEAWWTKNNGAFSAHHMTFNGHVCGTGKKGKRDMYLTEYNETKAQLTSLVIKESMQTPWKKERRRWFKEATKGFFSVLKAPLDWVKQFYDTMLCGALEKYANLSKEEAAKLTGNTEMDLTQTLKAAVDDSSS